VVKLGTVWKFACCKWTIEEVKRFMTYICLRLGCCSFGCQRTWWVLLNGLQRPALDSRLSVDLLLDEGISQGNIKY
jgi:hypothetical protein